ncbi:MAG: hypothetical protein E3J83_04305 [Candidatus Atribacteria bacterium]|nr:MAG: hypothetical protein E3J83_04305 [Candidatus Atribacteria bacterium]
MLGINKLNERLSKLEDEIRHIKLDMKYDYSIEIKNERHLVKDLFISLIDVLGYKINEDNQLLIIKKGK